MSLVCGVRWYQVCAVVGCASLLSSCDGSGGRTGNAHAYVANEGTLTTYTINPSTGGWTGAVGSPLVFPASSPFGGISQIATDPSGQYLYALDYSGVYVYAIDRNMGTLTAVAGSPFDAGSIPTSLAFDSSGTYLYVAGYSGVTAAAAGVLAAYSINDSGGLTPLAKYATPSDLSTVVAVGNYLYVAGFYTNSITAFSIDSTGTLSENVSGSPFATDTGPYSIVANPSGSVLYTANDGMPTGTEPTPGSISAFTIDSSTGALTPVAGNPQPIAAHGAPSIDPMGKFLLVPETSGVSVYAIDANTGALSSVAGSPFAAGTYPRAVSVDPTDQFVYVVNDGSASVSEFTIESTGALTPLPGSPAPVVNNPGYLATLWN